MFGSVLHGDDTEDSDLDLLVDPTKDTTMMDIAKIQWELSQLLPVAVDVLTPNGLPAKFRGQVIAEAQAIRAKVMFCVRWITLDTSWRPLTVSTAMLRT